MSLEDDTDSLYSQDSGSSIEQKDGLYIYTVGGEGIIECGWVFPLAS